MHAPSQSSSKSQTVVGHDDRSASLEMVIPNTHIDEGSPENAFRYNPATNLTLTKQPLSRFEATIEDAPSTAHERAIQYCMQLSEASWSSSQPVRVLVRFATFSQKLMLGSGQPSRNWVVNNTIYTMAMAKALQNKNLNENLSGDGYYDILMSLNADTNWYINTDGKTPPYTYDLVTVCLHESFHGLLMTGGNLQVQYNQNSSEYQARFLRTSIMGRFDVFMANHENCNIQGYNGNISAMGAVVTSSNMYFVSADGSRIAKLHTPRPYIEGSSIYHLSELEYGSGDDNNDLMTPVINAAYSQHNVGVVVARMTAVMLDTRAQNGAPMCESIGPPKVYDYAVTQSGSSDNGNTRDFSDNNSGFSVQIGSIQISGWAIVGAGVVCLLVTILIIVAAARRSSKPARKRPKKHHTTAEDRIVPGANSGGLC